MHTDTQTHKPAVDYAYAHSRRPFVSFVLIFFLKFLSAVHFMLFVQQFYAFVVSSNFAQRWAMHTLCLPIARGLQNVRCRNRRCQLNFMKNRGCIHLASVLMINARAHKWAAKQWQNKLLYMCVLVCCSFTASNWLRFAITTRSRRRRYLFAWI